jgi:peptide/nickel transport system substrate-binding protein
LTRAVILALQCNREFRAARRASREPIDKGGWNIFYTYLGGMGNISPGPDIAIRASGADAWFGWPTDPKMEALREAWFDAPDVEAQQKICRDMQEQFWQNPSYVPLGMKQLCSPPNFVGRSSR